MAIPLSACMLVDVSGKRTYLLVVPDIESMSMRNNAKQGRDLPISQNHSVVIVVLVLLTLPANGSGATKTIDVLSPCVCVVPEGTYTESLSQVDENRAQVEAYHVDL
jgi:hypothetical protein